MAESLRDYKENLDNVKFIALLDQDDDGCGYTISCGALTVALKAQTGAEAMEELYALLYQNENWGWGEKDGPAGFDCSTTMNDKAPGTALKRVMLFPVSHGGDVLGLLRTDFGINQKAQAALAEINNKITTEASERALLEELKAKYESN